MIRRVSPNLAKARKHYTHARGRRVSRTAERAARRYDIRPGVTGEDAEYVAAEFLGLKLVPARTPGYAAIQGVSKVRII